MASGISMEDDDQYGSAFRRDMLDISCFDEDNMHMNGDDHDGDSKDAKSDYISPQVSSTSSISEMLQKNYGALREGVLPLLGAMIDAGELDKAEALLLRQMSVKDHVELSAFNSLIRAFAHKVCVLKGWVKLT